MADGKKHRLFLLVARLLKMLPQEMRTDNVKKIVEDRL